MSTAASVSSEAWSQTIGQVDNSDSTARRVDVPMAMLVSGLILGGSAVGAYVGLQIGGPLGALRKLTVVLSPDGSVRVEVETIWA